MNLQCIVLVLGRSDIITILYGMISCTYRFPCIHIVRYSRAAQRQGIRIKNREIGDATGAGSAVSFSVGEEVIMTAGDEQRALGYRRIRLHNARVLPSSL